MQERFSEWVWEEPERARVLTDEYNRRFNSIVLRDYTTAGEYLTFPAHAESFTPAPTSGRRSRQRIAEPPRGRCGQAPWKRGRWVTTCAAWGSFRAMLVVPNHMLEQFSREWFGQFHPACPCARRLQWGSHRGPQAPSSRGLRQATGTGGPHCRGVFPHPRYPGDEHRYIEGQVVELKSCHEAAKVTG